jgi:hypothetical protein
MSEVTRSTITSSTATPAATIPGSIGGTVTREQQRRNTAEQDAIEDGESRRINESKKKEREPFKGKVDKLDGHVFQLAKESRKGNQYTQTLEALEGSIT